MTSLDLTWLGSYAIPTLCSECTTSKSVRKYYENQAELVKHFQQLHGPHEEVENSPLIDEEITNCDRCGNDTHCFADSASATSESGGCQLRTRHLAVASIVANLVLGAVKVLTATLAGSLAVVATLVESALQLLAGCVVLLAHIHMRNSSRYTYPQGRTRLEPVAFILLAGVLATATVQVLLKSVESLVYLFTGSKAMGVVANCLCEGEFLNTSIVDPTSSMIKTLQPTLTVIALIGFSVIVRASLLVLCMLMAPTHSGKILALAHINDIVCTLMALSFNLAATHLWLPLDPIGAILVSLFIGQSWIRLMARYVNLVTGKAANNRLMQLIIFASATHSPKITAVCSVSVYHMGLQCVAEVSIMLSPETPVRLAHDVAEGLQRKLETIQGVERAFVHPVCSASQCGHKLV